MDDRHQGFSLYEKVEFRPNIDALPKPVETNELQRFIPFIVVSFEDQNNEIFSLDIDYALYELLYKLNQGYIQTANDRNNHADFISFVDRILQTGSLTESVSVTSHDGKKANISQGMFGYKFKVVR